MSFTIKQGGRVDYNYKEVVVDNETELETLSIETMCPGSIVYIIETGDVYILNQKDKWIKQ